VQTECATIVWVKRFEKLAYQDPVLSRVEVQEEMGMKGVQDEQGRSGAGIETGRMRPFKQRQHAGSNGFEKMARAGGKAVGGR
jgi:hypothetical protein